MEAHLTVEVSGSTAMAHLTIRNDSRSDVYLEGYKIFTGGQLSNDVFDIRTGDTKIPYAGILAKRRRPIAADFVKLAPGKRLEAGVDLSRAYKFLAGKHRYQIRYEALHVLPDRDDFWTLKSNEASFTFSK